ncbi:MAG: QueT transporter family protein, partial [Chloroflexota bacterium]
MKEVISMWKNTRMIILVALTAAIYAAFLIAFKGGIVIVPGITEVRPANVFPPVFGLLFGPAGAWGSAIGNL